MTKPDFSVMTKDELKAYVRTHHEDEEAIRALFDRDKDKRTVYPAPKNLEETKAIFSKKSSS